MTLPRVCHIYKTYMCYMSLKLFSHWLLQLVHAWTVTLVLFSRICWDHHSCIYILCGGLLFTDFKWHNYSSSLRGWVVYKQRYTNWSRFDPSLKKRVTSLPIPRLSTLFRRLKASQRGWWCLPKMYLSLTCQGFSHGAIKGGGGQLTTCHTFTSKRL